MLRLFFLLLAFVAGNVIAQGFPSKPVRLIVTYPPGGSSDLMARVFGQKLSEVWGQQVIIESKPGAAGSIGMEFSARQPADASWSCPGIDQVEMDRHLHVPRKNSI